MKKKIISIVLGLSAIAGIGVVLANNKTKINLAAHPVPHHPVIPVKVAEVKMDTFQTSFSVTGSTVPCREVKIASEVQGKLVRLLVSNGDQVRRGQTLAILDASVYSVQLASIEASIAKAQQDLKRYTRLIELGGATPMQAESAQLQINSLEAEKKQVLEQISHMSIYAPFSGRIENLNVELGSFVSYGSMLAELIDLHSLKINVYLSEQEALALKAGDAVSVSSPLLPEAKPARINMISDKADASGKFLTEVLLPNQTGEVLKAGLITELHFALNKTETGLSIPVSGLVNGSDQLKVFVVKDNRASLRSIRAGRSTATTLQVIEGLQAGEQVVISGQMNLEEGTAISVNQ